MLRRGKSIGEKVEPEKPPSRLPFLGEGLLSPWALRDDPPRVIVGGVAERETRLRFGEKFSSKPPSSPKAS